MLNKSTKIRKKPFSKSLKRTVASTVWTRIQTQGEGKLWIYEDFVDLEFASVAITLSRLNKQGILKRIRPGVYYYPKKTVLGKSTPHPKDILECILRKKHIQTIPAGVDILNQLKITDQVSGSYTIAVDRRLSISDISGIKIAVLKRPLRDQEGISEAERAVLDACRNIKRIPNTNPIIVIKRIKELVINGQLNINRLINYAHTEPPRVRALIGSIAEDLTHLNIKIHQSNIKALKNSLNPLTYYKFGKEIKHSLNSADTWHII